MASTYSPSLRLELMGTGDQSGTWGVTTNTNLGTLLEQSITGYLSKAMADTNQTLTSLDGASDEARNMVVEVTGALTGAKNVVVPTAEKVYLFKNSTTGGFAVTIKTSAGTGVAVIPSTSQWVYCDGTNVVAGLTNLQTLSATALSPATTDGLALGTSSLMWSDLFLASGGVVNWNNGDVLITHSANTLTFTGATTYSFDGGFGGTAVASTTNQLTGTDATKMATPDSVAALWSKGVDVAAAAILTLGEGGLFNITGNTTITDIDFSVPADGRRATLIFEGNPLLTHNATTLNLPGAANIQVVAGDRCDIVQDDADNIYVTNYTPVGAAPYSAGSWTPAFSATGATFNYAQQVGRYIKIGKWVQVWGRIDLATSGNTLSANGVFITGLPFTTASGTPQVGGQTQWTNTTTSYIAIRIVTVSGTATMELVAQTAAATSLAVAVIASGLSATGGTTFRFSATYEAA